MGKLGSLGIIFAIVIGIILISSPIGGYESGLTSAFNVHPLLGGLVITVLVGGLLLRIYHFIKGW